MHDIMPIRRIDHVRFCEQREAGGVLLPHAVWLRCSGVFWAGDRQPNGGELCAAAERYSLRANCAVQTGSSAGAVAGQARRRRARHRLRVDDVERAYSEAVRRGRRARWSRPFSKTTTAKCISPPSIPTAKCCTRSSTATTTGEPSCPASRRCSSPASPSASRRLTISWAMWSWAR